MNQQEAYLKKLVAQGQDNLNICPDCFKAGRRKKFCQKMVVLQDGRETKLVVCYLGDKDSISKKAFKKKVKAMKKYKKWHMKVVIK